MTLLLDTHVWIWSQEDPEKIGRRARRLIEDADNGIAISAMTAMEIARLVFLRRIHLRESIATWMADSLRALGAMAIEVTPQIAAEAYELPGRFHKDPVDRVLVATARRHDLALVTADALILKYPHARTVSAAR